jgi:pepF/M3 family oligoendopeptidase
VTRPSRRAEGSAGARRSTCTSGADGAGSASDAPRWDLSGAYPDFDSTEYAADRRSLENAVSTFSEVAADRARAEREPGEWTEACIARINEIEDVAENLDVYCYTRYSVDTTNTKALREMNALQEALLPFHSALVDFRNNLAAVVTDPTALTQGRPALKEYAFFIAEQLADQHNQMSAAEENLAADLARSGADAWSRLQETVSANLSAIWDEESGEEKTVVQLRGLAFDPDRKVRKKAYETELAAWKRMEIPLAAALNGVKGTAVTVDGRRNYHSSLERARRSARVSQETLDALIAVMEESLPEFRRYLKAKARLIGRQKLAFFDLFAPVGAQHGGEEAGAGTSKWSFADARTFIVEQFRSFSDEMADYAERAFSEKWIDAKPRSGKVGGAYCASLPLLGQSRILANFDGSFSSVSTIAHELGHGYHHEVLKNQSAIHRSYPMTLAETASIFCETIVFTGAYDRAAESRKLGILEAFLQDVTQVIVDILSRYKFESAVFERRPSGELSAEEFKELMLEAQKATYGEGLDEDQLHPYMWAVKGHYYNHDLSFYNFPYAFGQLFGLGLFAQYRSRGRDFPPQYRRILELTGRASAEAVTAEAGFDIQTPEFWRSGIDYIRSRIDEFEERARAQ